MNLKSLAATAAIALSAVTFSPSAEAFTSDQCEYNNGVTICAEAISHTGSFNVWEVSVSEGNKSEVLTITCHGKQFHEYTSYGNFTKSEADAAARYWCAL